MRFFIFLFCLVSCGRPSTAERNIASLTNLNDRFGIPGLAGAIYKDGILGEISTYGLRKYDSETALESTDKFHLGSCTKAMTATLAAILIENGKLHWSSTIKELLPQMTLHPTFASMRFETLLVHRTGFPVEHSVINDVKSMSATDGRRIIAKKILTTAPLSFPDSQFTYSNYNYIIAGYILETILKTSWEELMKKHIFNPLEMNSCGFGATSTLFEENPSQPWGHYKKNGEITPLHFDNPLSFGPSSSIHCSLEDWSKFLIVHLKGFNGENNIVTAESYKKLHSPHPSGDSNYTYGGWHLLTREWARGPTLSHAGSNTFNYAKVWIAPKRNSFVVSTANIGGEDAFLATDAIIKKFIQDFL